MKGDFHVRFRENAGVRLPCVTRLAATLKDRSQQPFTFRQILSELENAIQSWLHS